MQEKIFLFNIKNRSRSNGSRIDHTFLVFSNHYIQDLIVATHYCWVLFFLVSLIIMSTLFKFQMGSVSQRLLNICMYLPLCLFVL